MLETLFGISSTTALGLIGTLATIVTLIVEVFKNILPDSFPTKALVLIVSLIVTLGFVCIFSAISIKMILAGILGSFVVSFVSMYGFDTLKSLIERYKYK